MQRWVRDLNRTYAAEPRAVGSATSSRGLHVDRLPRSREQRDLVRPLRGRTAAISASSLVNFTPLPRAAYRIGVPRAGAYREVLNSDAEVYGGSGVVNGRLEATDHPSHNFLHSITLTVPPLGFVLLKPDDR